jgi:hypothetical protein
MDHDTFASLVGAAGRSARDPRALDRLLVRCWPGGGDRLEPSAVRWVRRWGPQRVAVTPPECGCAGGRCGVCN